ncbi:MAG: ParB/RepB/Spo0J family partition protein [Phormidesmis sp. RL_2_1]|nr:ParB/RepB/Spo0J family partition protein [Phormidesmis sp. RL_2_1]
MPSKKKQITPHKFKGIDDFLNGQSASDAVAESVSIDQIVLPANQPRRYFDEKAMQELTASVRQHGILQPLLVRSVEGDRYELVAGERRYRAAKATEMETIPVIIKKMSDDDATEIAILENLQRQDLNPIEETEAILDLISKRLSQSQATVISLLNRASHAGLKSADNVIHTSEWKIIESVFEIVGRFTPESFRSNRLPLLKLPIDVLEELRTGSIQYTKAREVAKIQDSEARQSLLREVIASNMPLREIRDHIKESKSTASSPSAKKESAPSDLFIKRIASIQVKAKQSNIWSNKSRTEKVKSLLAELEALIDAE